ncbi:MAG: HAD-IA family hydrolase [Burkholderiaceae bacterium]
MTHSLLFDNGRLSTKPAAILFDLDGTLADTAADLCAPANKMRADRGLAPMPVAELGKHASSGARGILGCALGVTPDDKEYESLRLEFLSGYEQCLVNETALFPGMEQVIDNLESLGILWGVVSNKTEKYVVPILEQLSLINRSACAIGGDTAARAKPHPDPLFLAAKQLGVLPERCVYVGDDLRDIQAGESAGMATVAAAYGYCGEDSPPNTWGANIIIDSPVGLLKFLPA